MIPYLPQSAMAISEVFASYNDNILLVKNDNLNEVYVPTDDINTIVTMYPGEGYYVYLRGENDIEFSYPVNGLSRTEFSDILETERIARTPVHYKIKDTGISHPILITDISGVVEIGDELSAYANNELVGAVKIISLDQPLPLTTFGSYKSFGFNLPGYNVGDEIELRLWSNKWQNELEVITELDQNKYGMSPLSRGSAEVQSLIPDEYSLSQAYPNPFNPTTTIKYALPEDTKLSIMIYDIQGRELLRLADGEKEAGYHSLIWNASSYSSGIYFVRMVAFPSSGSNKSNYTKTQKLMLVK